MKRGRRGWPLVTLGHLWSQTSPGVWSRHVIRRYEGSGETEVQEVAYVEQEGEPAYTFCFRCMSPHVATIQQYDWVWYHCQTCEFEFRIE
jgi:hypothetical protein